MEANSLLSSEVVNVEKTKQQPFTGKKRKLPDNIHHKHERRKRKPIRNVITPIDIYIRGHVPIQAYFHRAIKLLETEKRPFIVIHALGKLISKAVSVACLLQTYNNHQFDLETNTDTVKAIDELIYEDTSIEPELDVRSTSAIHITVKNKINASTQ